MFVDTVVTGPIGRAKTTSKGAARMQLFRVIADASPEVVAEPGWIKVTLGLISAAASLGLGYITFMQARANSRVTLLEAKLEATVEKYNALAAKYDTLDVEYKQTKAEVVKVKEHNQQLQIELVQVKAENAGQAREMQILRASQAQQIDLDLLHAKISKPPEKT